MNDPFRILSSFAECITQGNNLYHAVQDSCERRELREENARELKRLRDQCKAMSAHVNALYTSSQSCSAHCQEDDMHELQHAIMSIRNNFRDLDAALAMPNNDTTTSRDAQTKQKRSSLARIKAKFKPSGSEHFAKGKSPILETSYQHKALDEDKVLRNVADLRHRFRDINSRIESIESFKAVFARIRQEGNHIIAGFRSEVEREHEKTRYEIRSLKNTPQALDVFKPFFYIEENPPGVVLDFELQNEGKPETLEGQLKRFVLSVHDTSAQVSDVGKILLGVIGMGGVGKTCALRGLAQDNDVKSRYYGGIHWISLGQNADDSKYVHELAKIVIDSGGVRKYEELRQCNDAGKASRDAAIWFKEAHAPCLFICDDLWSVPGRRHGHFHLLRQLACPELGSTIIFSSRQHVFAEFAKVIWFEPGSAQSAICRRMLLQQVGISENVIAGNDIALKYLDNILRRCCGLPVAIAVAGCALRYQCSLRKLDVYEAIESQALGSFPLRLVENEVYEYGNLYGAIIASLEMMEEEASRTLNFSPWPSWPFRKFFRSLCVVEKQTVIKLPLLHHLWRYSEKECRIIAEKLASLSLASLFPSEEFGLTMHDLIHDIATRLAEEQNEIEHWNRKLLEGYACPWIIADEEGFRDYRQWWSIMNDKYIYTNLARHLKAAGQTAELVSLITDDRWLRAQLRESGILRIEADFEICCAALDQGGNGVTAPLKEGLRRISKALTLSYGHISQNTSESEFAFHLLARLLDGGEPRCSAVTRLLRNVKQHTKAPWVEPLRNFLPSPDSTLDRTIPIKERAECIALFNEDKNAAVGTRCGSILIFDLNAHKLLHRKGGHDDCVRCVTVTQNGKLLLSGSDDGTIALWDLETYNQTKNLFQRHTRGVRCIATIPDKTRIVSGSSDGTIRIWNLDTRQQNGPTLRGHKGCVNCLVVNANNLWSGGIDRTVRVWDLENCPQSLKSIMSHRDWVQSLTATPDGKIIASSDYNEIHLWNAETQERVGDIIPHSARCMVMPSDGKRILFCDGDKFMVWDIEFRQLVYPPIGLNGIHVKCLAMFRHEDRIVAVGNDDNMRIWNFRRPGFCACTTRSHFSAVNCIGLIPGGRGIVSGGKDGAIFTWDMNTCDIASNVPIHGKGCVKRIGVAPNGKIVMFLDEDWRLHSWNLEKCERTEWSTNSPSDIFNCFSFATDSRRFASGHRNGAIYLWDLETARQVPGALTGHLGHVVCLAFSRDGKRLVSGANDRSVRIWELGEKSIQRHTLYVQNDWIQSVTVVPNDSAVVAVCSGDVVRMWNIVTGKCLSEERVVGGKRLNSQALQEYASILTEKHCENSFAWVIDSHIVLGGCPNTILAHFEENINRRNWFYSREDRILCVIVRTGVIAFMRLHF